MYYNNICNKSHEIHNELMTCRILRPIYIAASLPCILYIIEVKRNLLLPINHIAFCHNMCKVNNVRKNVTLQMKPTLPHQFVAAYVNLCTKM